MSALSLKELMYDEIFYSYPDELNDPLDLGAELLISSGSSFVYSYFILEALRLSNRPRSENITTCEKSFASKLALGYSKKTHYVHERSL